MLKDPVKRVQHYVAKHQNIPHTVDICIHSDGCTPVDRWAVSGKPFHYQSMRKNNSFWWRSHLAPNSVNEVGFVDFDPVLQVGELSVIRFNTKSFKTCPAPRYPEWVQRFFFVAGERFPRTETGKISCFAKKYSASKYFYGYFNRTFRSQFGRRLVKARESIKWADFVGSDSFLDGNKHFHAIDENWGFWALETWFTTVSPRFSVNTKKQKGDKLIEAIKQASWTEYPNLQVAQAFNNDWVFTKLKAANYRFTDTFERIVAINTRPEKYNEQYMYVQYKDGSVQRINSSLQDAMSKSYDLGDFAKLYRGEEFVNVINNKETSENCSDRSEEKGWGNLTWYLNFLKPIYEAIVKASNLRILQQQKLDTVFGPIDISRHKLLQKLGINQQQFDWIAKEANFNDPLIATLKQYRATKNIANLTEQQFLVGRLSRVYGTEEILLPWLNEQADSSVKTVLLRALLDKDLNDVYPSLRSTVIDTLRMYRQLKDTIGFPEEITMAKLTNPTTAHSLHDLAIRQMNRYRDLQQAEKDKFLQKSLDALKPKRAKLEYEEDDYVLRSPNSLQEIRDEGRIQNICIGGYANSYAQGKTDLYFVRKKKDPNTPFLAIEVGPETRRVQQIHGYHNGWVAALDPKCVPFLYRWKEKKNVSCDDRILLLQATGYCGTGTMMPKPEY